MRYAGFVLQFADLYSALYRKAAPAATEMIHVSINRVTIWTTRGCRVFFIELQRIHWRC